MKKVLAGLVMVCFVFIAVSAQAGQFGDLKKRIGDARDSLVTMVKNKDKRGADQQKLVKDTADAVSAGLAGMKAPAGKEVQYKELVDTWNAFKKSREEEVVPLLLSGKQEEAEKLAGGVQKERFMKINALCDELGK